MPLNLLEHVRRHTPCDAREAAMTRRLQKFLEAAQNENPFARDLIGIAPENGHVTGSAWIVALEYSRAVLLHHKKLGKWVQPGGHCDGESDVAAVARREAEEETGLKITPAWSTPEQAEIFDIDVHAIPEYWNTPAHLHFDVRYLFFADDAQIPLCSDESRAVRWVSLDEALELSCEESVARMVRKTRRLKERDEFLETVSPTEDVA